MVKSVFFYLLASSFFLFGYEDDELSRLWKSIPDINHPTWEDYKAIDDYLQFGERPYLFPFYESLEKGELNPSVYQRRLELIRNYRLLGSNGEEPIFEMHRFSSNASDRCILLYGSQNGIYPEKTRTLFTELKERGYKGDILLRIGGFPNTEQGGLKICHVPYSFKAAFLKEAQRLGYKKVLWLDTAIHPLTDLDAIFEEIEEKGFFLTYVGTLADNAPSHLQAAADALDLDPLFYTHIKHLSSSIMGLNFTNPNANALLDLWIEYIERALPNATWFPEELSLAAAAWRSGCIPTWPFAEVVCAQEELDQIYSRFNLQFFLDSLR